MASSCISCCIFHIISIPFNCTDTALRVPEAMIGAKFKIFVFHHVCFVSRQIWCQNSSPVSLAFSHLRNRAEISQMKPRRISSTTDQASSVSHVHVKRPKVNWWVRHAMHRFLGQVHVEKLPGKYHYKNKSGTGARLTACNGRGGVAGKKKGNLQIEDMLNLLLKITTVP